MPADDLVLNVKQIAGYTATGSAPTTASILMQLAGLGSAYASISPANFVATALAAGGDMHVAGQLSALSFSGGSAQFSNAAVNLFTAQKACIVDFNATWGTVGGVPIATVDFVAASTVASFNGRAGAVQLWLEDIINAGGAPNFSPVFGGEPRAPTPAPWSNSSRLATTGFVQRNSVLYIQDLLDTHPFVFTFNGRTGNVVLTEQDIINAGGGDIFDSPTFTGIPIAPTAPVGTNTQQVATTAFVNAEIAASTLFAPIDSPQFTGFPSGPTATPGSSTGQLATTAFVMDAVAESTAGVATFNTRTGNVTLLGADITGAGGALIASPVFTGTPQAPTAAPGTATAQLATCAFVNAAIGGIGVETFNGRAGAVTLTTADITGAGGAPIASPAFTGNPTAPTPAPGDSDTSIATTAYVQAALSTGGVTSFNTRTGAITLLASDISAAGGATLVSPVFTGIPVAPTATAGTTTAQLATCAFVANAISNSVSSFNGRTGAITLSASDISAAGGAPLASPHFNGAPTAPTPATSDNSTAIATTAFVNAAIGAASGVTTFNGRAGAVTLSASDISAAGGAPVASPTFTGIPSAPTAAASTSTTQLATCAFVMNQISLGGGVLSFNGRAGTVILTLADVTAAFPVSTAPPLMNGVASPGSSAAWSAGDHIHPSDTSKLSLSGGSLTGPVTSSAAGNFSALTTTGTVTATGALVSNDGVVRLVQTGSAAIQLQMFAPNGTTQVGNLNWNANVLGCQNSSAAGAGLGGWQIDTLGRFIADHAIGSAIGYMSRANGTAGPFVGNNFNIQWFTSAPYLWIDNTNVGQIAFVSDYRVKKNVADLPSTWDRVKQLRPISYSHTNFTPDSAVRGADGSLQPLLAADDIERWGFIAHELQETLVESAATGVKDDPVHVQSPNPWTVIATLTRGLQEAMARIETLEGAAA